MSPAERSGKITAAVSRDTTLSHASGDSERSVGESTWGSADDADGTLKKLQLPSGALLGRYTILRDLGAGAMGEVYAAYDPDLDRKIALKILKPRLHVPGDSNADEGKLRLLREAKALARLSHPNVVAIHDVGTIGERVFIAMEFVDGQTLTKWLEARARSWREIADVMCLAGEGLAAAHDAGLIHRDFKPDNVVIGHDNRVRVLDFGLARAAAEPAELAPAELSVSGISRSSSIEVGITSTGVLVGTPAYMAPEQHIGQPADPRSDLFAFCVTFFQALYGERPFDGNDLPTLAGNVIRGRLRPPPAGSKVPSWLHRAIVQGLKVSPAERYPSMRALLERLGREPAARRRRGFALVGAPALLVGLAIGTLRGDLDPPCQGARDRLQGVWDAPRRDALNAAFARTGLSYAAASAQTVTAALDDYADRWVAAHTEACEDTLVRNLRSPQALDLRMLCLDRHRAELDALTDILVTADPSVVEHAVEAVGKLADLGGCSDTDALLQTDQPPTDPVSVEKLRGIREQLAQAKALDATGKLTPALDLALAARDAARHLAYAPVVADAHLVVADLQQQRGDTADALQSLQDAAIAGATGRHDEAVARAYIDLIAVASQRLAHYDEALWAGRAAEVAIHRVRGATALLEARRDLYLAVVLNRTGDAKAARPLAEAALQTFTREYNRDHPLVHRSLTGLALIDINLGDIKSAHEHLKEALEIARRVSGPEHPSVAAVLTNLAKVRGNQGHLDEALALAQEAVQIRERALGPDHPDLALSLQMLAEIEATFGKTDDAYRHLTQALTIFEHDKNASPDHRGSILNTLALFDLARNDLPAAHTHFRAAYDDLLGTLGAKHIHSATAAANLAEVILKEGHPADAVALLAPAVAAHQGAEAPDPEVAYVLGWAGQAALANGAPADAADLFAEALRLQPAAAPATLDVAQAHVGLARARLALGDPGGARTSADHARHALAGLDPADADRVRADLDALVVALR